MSEAGPSWEQVRSEFPIACRKVPLIDGSEATLLYLDHAASTHAPRCVLDRYTRFMADEYANIHRGTHLLSRAATAAFDECYSDVARFIGGDLRHGSVIFLGNTTQAIDLVAHVVDPLPGKVLVTELEHHSNDLPWRKRGPLVRARVTPEGRLDLDDVRNQLRANQIKLLAVTGASNVTGWMPDIHALARLAHEHGALISVDAAQLLAHRTIDIKPPDDPEHLDFVAAAGHKAYAPFGSSFLFGPRWLLDEAPPYLPGGGTASRVTARSVEFVASPDRHQGGTPNIAGVIGLAESLRFLSRIGMARIREHERELVAAAMAGLGGIDGVTVYGPAPADERLAVITFNVAGVSDLLGAAVLSEERGIACRNGRFCAHIYADRLLTSQGGYTAEPDATPGAVRASFGLYNTMADVARLIEGVQMLREGAWKGRYRVLGPGSHEVVQAEFAGRCNDLWMAPER